MTPLMHFTKTLLPRQFVIIAQIGQCRLHNPLARGAHVDAVDYVNCRTMRNRVRDHTVQSQSRRRIFLFIADYLCRRAWNVSYACVCVHVDRIIWCNIVVIVVVRTLIGFGAALPCAGCWPIPSPTCSWENESRVFALGRLCLPAVCGVMCTHHTHTAKSESI